MNKTIIAIYGRANEGKSETIKRVCKTLLSSFPNANPSVKDFTYDYDILLTIQLDTIKIGIESQGDPKSRMINHDTIKKLAMENCDIIICATRTSGETVDKVDEIALDYDYQTLWMSSYWSKTMNHDVLNQMAADNIIAIIKSIVIGQI